MVKSDTDKPKNTTFKTSTQVYVQAAPVCIMGNEWNLAQTL